MTTQDETTMSQYAENDNDELLLLTGDERLAYFSDKPTFKSNNMKEHLLAFCHKFCR